MKSRLIGHGIDMGLIQPLPPTPTTHTGGTLFDSDDDDDELEFNDASTLLGH